jgi:hypothetical protein
MEAIGDLLEPITGRLYDWRVEIAIGSVIAVAILAVVAWRAGWLGAARRHPGRSAALAGAFLAIAVPVGWYMASPLVVRTSLVEATPTVVPSTAPPMSSAGATATAQASDAGGPSPTIDPTATPFVPTTIAMGSFTGTDDFHFGSGTASIIELEPGRYHLRLDAFSVRNGPDLFVVLSPDRDSYTDAAFEVGRLKATDGAFGYDLPDGFDPSGYRSALIWCKQFAHLFAVAPFEA